MNNAQQHLHTAKRLLLAVGVVGGVIILSLLFFAILKEGRRRALNVPTPRSWMQIEEYGQIARPCFGAWEECGSIHRAYKTNQTPTEALEQLRTSLTSKGWVLRVDEPESVSSAIIMATAKDNEDSWDQIGSVKLSPGKAEIEYVHR